jgi:DNA-directed RNA polymerase specialized sigma subunit
MAIEQRHESSAIGAEIRVFNWPLRRARIAAGFTRSQLARNAKLSPTLVCAAEALKIEPSENAKVKIAIALGRGVTELWPEELDGLIVKQTSIEVQLPTGETTRSEYAMVEDDYTRAEMLTGLTDAVDKTLHGLHETEELVLRMRFGIGEYERVYMLSEIGEVMGITRERVRQIEASALRKMRHPKNSRYLREWCAESNLSELVINNDVEGQGE